MRRYGWEQYDEEAPVCSWMDCYKPSIYNKSKCLQFAWFLVLKLLHTQTSTALEALRNRHDPMVVREMRASRTMF